MDYKAVCDYLESCGCLVAPTAPNTTEFSVSFAGDIFGIVNEDSMRFYTDGLKQTIAEFGILESKKDIRRFKAVVHRYIGGILIGSRGLRRFVEKAIWGLLPQKQAMVLFGILAYLCGTEAPGGDDLGFWMYMGIVLLSSLIYPPIGIVWIALFVIAVLYCY